MLNVTGSKGNHVLKYYDADTNTEVDIDTAIKYYGARAYMAIYKDDYLYFYRGKEISKSEYEKGSVAEEADIRAQNIGDAAYRVKNTAEIKKAFDDIYKKLKIGTFYLEFSTYESSHDINWDEVYAYYKDNYGLNDVRQNYYSYNVKGNFEPDRFMTLDSQNKSNGELEISSKNIRITGNEMNIVNKFLEELLPLMQGDGSDYQKILAAYTYIKSTTSYLTDDGFVNDLLASNTSVYDALINRKSVCIGYSIAFSYLMDKMGIESYIVDQITSVDENKQTFNSVHTYNIVKLDGKFYKVDTTGSIFLAGIGSNDLYNSKLPISTSAYNRSGKSTTYYFDYNKINTILNKAKSTKTTTTAEIRRTSTATKTTSIKTTKGNNTTQKVDDPIPYNPSTNPTNPSNTNEPTTSGTPNSGETNTTNNASNNGEGKGKTTKQSNSNGQDKVEDIDMTNEEEDKSGGNIFLGLIAVFVTGIFIVYKLVFK